MDQQGITLVGLRVKNFLSISDIELKPKHITQIVGANNNGKTSLLRAIEIGLKGSTDGSLVKVGESQAEILLEFSDGLSVHRKINATGTQTVRAAKNEMVAQAPQTMLNSLFDTSAFNPLELLEPKRRQEALLQAVPARVTEEQIRSALAPLPIDLPPTDYSKHGLQVLDQLHSYFYSRRTEANKKAKEEAERIKFEAEKVSSVEPEKGTHEDADLDRMGGECDAEIRQLQQKQGEYRLKERQLKELQEGIRADEQGLRDLEQQLADLRNLIERRKQQEADIQRSLLDVGSVQPRIDELNGFKLRHSGEKTKNANHRNWLAQKHNLEGQQARANTAAEFAKELDRCVSALGGKAKADMMQQTAMPVPGITYADGKFFFEGFSIENLSTSQAMKLACGIARALAKKTKVICLDGAEALDEASYVMLKNEIHGDGFTYFISKVGEAFKASEGDTVVTMHEGKAIQ